MNLTLEAPLSPETRRRWVLLALAAQVLFMLAVAGAGYAIGRFGEVVTLRTSPVDPRDLLYGDYVVLNYDISTLRIRQWRGTTRPRPRQAVYVELQPGPSGAYEAVAAYPHEPPALPAGHVALRGWVANAWRNGLQVRYGLEKYYVPEDSELALKTRGRGQSLLVQVSIAPWGQARINGIEQPVASQ